jgi:cold shock CspA family protein
MPRGTISSFDASRGSGLIHLETGDQVHFDVSVATTPELAVGRPAEVVTGLGRGGQLIARIVLVDEKEESHQPFVEGFAALQQVGLFSQWTLQDARDRAGDTRALTRAGAGELLWAYYGAAAPPERGRADRIAVLDEPFGEPTVIPVDELVSFATPEVQEALRLAASEARPVSLGAVLAAFNAVFQRRALPWHYYLFDAGSDRYAAVALREDSAARAAHGTVLRVVS